MRRLLLLSLLGALACTTAQDKPPPASPAPGSQAPAPRSRGGAGSGEITVDTSPGSAIDAELGRPCDDAGARGGAACGTRGRSSIVRIFGGLDPTAIPCKLERTSKDPKPPAPPAAGSTWACATDERVYVSSTCAMCRLPGRSAIGLIAEMTDAQIKEVATLGGLGDSVPRDAAAWRRAIASARS